MNAVVKPPTPFARILDVTEKQYFDDPCEVPSLSQSIAHKMVALSPLHAWTVHPKLGRQQEEGEEDSTGAMIAGKIIHRLLLGKGADIVVCPFDAFRTNAAKEMRDEALAAGKIPIVQHKYAEIAATAELLSDKLKVLGYSLDGGESEVAIEWDEDGERGPVRCRGRMDYLKRVIVQILDVKKIVSAHPDTVSRHIYNYGYDIQWAAYTSAVGKLCPGFADRVDMVDLFMEINPPYAITPVRMSEAFREIGRMRWQRAILLWERCLATNRWPEYASDTITVEPQPYVMTREIDSGNW